jgi:hypothetical protein
MAVSRATASKWVNRYRQFGELGLLDRSSAPTRQPTATSSNVITLLPGIHDEHEAGVGGEHDRGLMVPVILFSVSVSCSCCRRVMLTVPAGSGRTRAWAWCC